MYLHGKIAKAWASLPETGTFPVPFLKLIIYFLCTLVLLHFPTLQISPSENSAHSVGTGSLEVMLGVTRTWKYDLPTGAGQGWGAQLARQADTALRNDGDGDGDRSQWRQVAHQENS